MKCRKCNAELAENAKFCPECGCSVDGKMSPGKIALLVVLAIAAVAVVVALVAGSRNGNEETTETTQATETTETTETTEATVPENGDPSDVTAKGSYTVPDADMIARMNDVVATAGDAELTNAELQVYYWLQVYDMISTGYATYYGLDYSQPLDTQITLDGSMTWQQSFLQNAITGWHSYKAMTMEGQANGYELDQEYLDYLAELPATLESGAISSGFANASEMLQADMGVGTNVDTYLKYMYDYTYGYMYYTHLMEEMELTAEDVEAYYDANAASYQAGSILKDDENYVDVRHILVMPTGGTTNEDGTTTYSDEEWEACRQAAQAILDEWLAGDATEASFAALANEKSEDTGSNTTGGLYTNVYKGQMVEPFENWCFDESRAYGDTGLVQTTYGYHVMFFVDSTPVWYATAESDLLTERSNALVEEIMNKYPLTVDYTKVAIGTVDFAVES